MQRPKPWPHERLHPHGRPYWIILTAGQMMTDEKQKMTDTDVIASTNLTDSAPASLKDGAKRRRNIFLAIVLAIGALSMYASIFYRLSVSPLE